MLVSDITSCACLLHLPIFCWYQLNSGSVLDYPQFVTAGKGCLKSLVNLTTTSIAMTSYSLPIHEWMSLLNIAMQQRNRIIRIMLRVRHVNLVHAALGERLVHCLLACWNYKSPPLSFFFNQIALFKGIKETMYTVLAYHICKNDETFQKAWEKWKYMEFYDHNVSPFM